MSKVIQRDETTGHGAEEVETLPNFTLELSSLSFVPNPALSIKMVRDRENASVYKVSSI